MVERKLLEEGDSFALPDDKHNFNEWKLKFDKALKWTMDDVDDYLGELGFGLQLQIKTDYSFSGGKSKWLAAYCKREHDVTEDGVIMIALNYHQIWSKMNELGIDDDSFNIEAQANITLWHEIGHALVDFFKNFKIDKYNSRRLIELKGKLNNLTKNKEEQLVEEFGESWFPEGTGVWNSELKDLIFEFVNIIDSIDSQFKR